MEVIRKKVYVCPETTCVHHDPSRALGDLTGIKKHFSRKHGEKKWKCEKCSKRYAVQSDWKAHSKICGTKEYRCDCGTLFSRRDSFITHRAFCDALAEESARAIPTLPSASLFSSQQQVQVEGSTVSHNLATLQQQQPQVLHSHSHALQGLAVKREQDINYLLSGRSVAAADHSLPPWLACSSSFLDQNHENPSQTQNPSFTTTTLAPFQTPTPHMSATALLQKAAQMGVTMSSSKPLQSPAAMQRPHMSGTAGFIGSSSTPAGSTVGLSARDHQGLSSGLTFPHGLAASFGNKAAATNSTAGSKDVVIICHGFQSIKERIPMVSIANVLERQGISAFRFDFAGNGESEGSFMYGNYRREAEDLRAVVQHFCNLDRPVTAIIGHSKGGNVVLLYASKYNDVPTVISISGRFNLEKGMEGRLGKDFLQKIKQNGFIDVFNRKGKFEYRVTQESLMDRLSTDTRAACLLIDQNCRVLIIHGSMDKIVPAKDALEFARFIRNHKLHIVEGADHEYTSHQDELTKIVLDFVREGRQDKNTTQDSQSCNGGVRSRI
ncbi:hypothetical protein COLO4_21072 [Corchorus olitorius]|uniref:Uncharacterized protein n=1 Tax=Corchorus olitorius TaxID=93759 RepID=A0A1R3IVF8_9ROSI|nr:hypothetical protein COLO4_21072 [Corchorus olitorius]